MGIPHVPLFILHDPEEHGPFEPGNSENSVGVHQNGLAVKVRGSELRWQGQHGIAGRVGWKSQGGA